jgi:hypothetical protein
LDRGHDAVVRQASDQQCVFVLWGGVLDQTLKKLRVHVGIWNPIRAFRQKSEELLCSGFGGLAPTNPQRGEFTGMLVEPLAQYFVRRVHAFFQQPSVGAFRGFLGLVELFDQIGMWIQLAHGVMIVIISGIYQSITSLICIFEKNTNLEYPRNYQFCSA